jgi:hypothetical protein
MTSVAFPTVNDITAPCHKCGQPASLVPPVAVTTVDGVLKGVCVAFKCACGAGAVYPVAAIPNAAHIEVGNG